MSLIPTASWTTPETPYFATAAGGGGSNFPNGIVIGSASNTIQQGIIGSSNLLYVSNSNGVNSGLLAQTVWAGDVASSYLQMTSTTLLCALGSDPTGTTSRLIKSNLNNLTACFDLENVNRISGTNTTSTSNTNWAAANFTLNPTTAALGGSAQVQITWDATDTGANNQLLLAATSSNALIASIWPGQQSMALQITGANINLASDNENFIFMEGNAGGLGYVSTGVPFLSGSNFMSSIKAPGTSNANMGALLSTLQSLYPACFS